jgi:hypothetical protein
MLRPAVEVLERYWGIFISFRADKSAGRRLIAFGAWSFRTKLLLDYQTAPEIFAHLRQQFAVYLGWCGWRGS